MNNLSLERLENWNPLRFRVWYGMETPVSHNEIAESIRAGQLESDPVKQDFFCPPIPRKIHAARIAYLVQHPPTDPIEIDVGGSLYGRTCRLDHTRR